jgi:hypothetical protein
MAYILGFWWTDGHITKDIFSISQHKKDKYILEDMLRSMSSDYPIYNGNANNCVFMIRSKKIVDDLKKIGGQERKTKTAIFPRVPLEFLPDFIRGAWDGDGCITRQYNRKSFNSTLTSSSKEFLIGVQSSLKKNVSGFLGGSIIKSTSKKGKLMPNGTRLKKDSHYYFLSLSSNDTKRLGKFMYGTPSTLMLKRKEEIFSSLSDVVIATYDREYLSYEDSKKVMKVLAEEHKLKTWTDWRKFSKTEFRPSNVPSNPQRSYKDEFCGIKDFLGVQKPQ